jgi:hypothetical protein
MLRLALSSAALVSAATALLAEATPTATLLALALAMTLGVPVAVLLATAALALSLAVLFAVLLVCLVRSSPAAATPPSAPLPSGVAGRRIRSLIHVALVSKFICLQVAGLSHL